jgi:hypothetical protein
VPPEPIRAKRCRPWGARGHATRKELPLINLQADKGGKAKPYQVRQVLTIIEDFSLEVAS